MLLCHLLDLSLISGHDFLLILRRCLLQIVILICVLVDRHSHLLLVLCLEGLNRLSELLDLLTILHALALKTLYLDCQFIDNAPCNHLLLGQPSPRLCITGLLEEQIDVEQIPELVALENLDLDTKDFGVPLVPICQLDLDLLSFVFSIIAHASLLSSWWDATLLFKDGLECADVPPVIVSESHVALLRVDQIIRQILDATIEQGLQVAREEGELLDVQVLVVQQGVEFLVIDGAQEEVAWIRLVVQ